MTTFKQQLEQAATEHSFAHPDNDRHLDRYTREEGFKAGIHWLLKSEAMQQVREALEFYASAAEPMEKLGLGEPNRDPKLFAVKFGTRANEALALLDEMRKGVE